VFATVKLDNSNNCLSFKMLVCNVVYPNVVPVVFSVIGTLTRGFNVEKASLSIICGYRVMASPVSTMPYLSYSGSSLPGDY